MLPGGHIWIEGVRYGPWPAKWRSNLPWALLGTPLAPKVLSIIRFGFVLGHLLQQSGYPFGTLLAQMPLLRRPREIVVVFVLHAFGSQQLSTKLCFGIVQCG